MEVDELLKHSRNAVEAEKQGITAMWCSELSITADTLKSLYHDNDMNLDACLFEVEDDYTVITFELAGFTYTARLKTKEYFNMIAQKKTHINGSGIA
ncbi:hypothetical protein SAMN05216232_0216 [Virgibacillus subterraneus]|uniref:Uncharacterized protein n=1 Tax=Virgibacillus subterraneus TaxID=621109 RepID=A0A1H8YZW0_9BACI|nr:hypothetical protein [Virgibacillus subterraneus]SEP57623.1 hypothetical protein SAMN05216232_0216 [Virgibacillus subterraneus]